MRSRRRARHPRFLWQRARPHRLGPDAEEPQFEVVVGGDDHLGRSDEIVLLPACVLQQMGLEFFGQRRLVRAQALAVSTAQVDDEAMRDVDARGRLQLALLHLLDQLLGQLDGLHVALERAAEDALEALFRLAHATHVHPSGAVTELLAGARRAKRYPIITHGQNARRKAPTFTLTPATNGGARTKALNMSPR